LTKIEAESAESCHFFNHAFFVQVAKCKRSEKDKQGIEVRFDELSVKKT